MVGNMACMEAALMAPRACSIAAEGMGEDADGGCCSEGGVGLPGNGAGAGAVRRRCAGAGPEMAACGGGGAMLWGSPEVAAALSAAEVAMVGRSYVR
jgi:hypothetical protein